MKTTNITILKIGATFAFAMVSLLISSMSASAATCTEGDLIWEVVTTTSVSPKYFYSSTVEYGDHAFVAGSREYDADTDGVYEQTQLIFHKVNKADGVILTQLTYNPSDGFDDVYDMYVAGDYLYVAGTATPNTATNDRAWLILRINLNTFQVEESYMKNYYPVSGTDDYLTGVTSDGVYVYVSGMVQQSDGTSVWRVEARDTMNLSLLRWSHEHLPDAVGGLAAASEIALYNSDELIIVGQIADTIVGPDSWKIEKVATSGTPIVLPMGSVYPTSDYFYSFALDVSIEGSSAYIIGAIADTDGFLNGTPCVGNACDMEIRVEERAVSDLSLIASRDHFLHQNYVGFGISAHPYAVYFGGKLSGYSATKSNVHMRSIDKSSFDVSPAWATETSVEESYLEILPYGTRIDTDNNYAYIASSDRLQKRCIQGIDLNAPDDPIITPLTNVDLRVPNTDQEFIVRVDDIDGGLVDITIDWGDGDVMLLDDQPANTNITVYHTFPEGLLYTISVTAEDETALTSGPTLLDYELNTPPFVAILAPISDYTWTILDDIPIVVHAIDVDTVDQPAVGNEFTYSWYFGDTCSGALIESATVPTDIYNSTVNIPVAGTYDLSVHAYDPRGRVSNCATVEIYVYESPQCDNSADDDGDGRIDGYDLVWDATTSLMDWELCNLSSSIHTECVSEIDTSCYDATGYDPRFAFANNTIPIVPTFKPGTPADDCSIDVDVLCEDDEESQCSDGVDNDSDGYTDSDDPGCWVVTLDSNTYDPFLSENNCGNTICEETYETDTSCPKDCDLNWRETR